MIVLVCGGRDFTDSALLAATLSQYNIRGLIHGAARGADTLARDWIKARIKAEGKKTQLWSAGYPAQWNLHGKAAGPIRNQEMLDQNPGIELVIAFPGGTGTADMVAKAKKAGIKLVEIT